MSEVTAGRVIGRYALYDPLALGGMATVHIARLLGPVGFARTVAIKRLHPQYARDPEFVSMFLDEARMCARIRHPNVVPTLDVVATQGELFLVMEYIQGESLSHLIKAARQAGQKIPWRVAVTIGSGTLHGLHAAHEAKDERGMSMNLVHRDVSPQNILVGVDGMARVVDFGIAKATGRIHTTREGAVKGKLGYMAYEQMSGGEVTRQSDVYAAAVVLWETLTCRRLFDGETEAMVLAKVLTEEMRPPSAYATDIPQELDDIVMKGLSRDTAERYPTAREMAQALDRLSPAPVGAVGEWVESLAKTSLEERASRVSQVEEGSGELTPATLEGPPPATPQVARSGGSFRPTSTSDYDAAAPAPKPRPKWLIPAGVATVLLIGAGVWAAARTTDTAPAAQSAAAAPPAVSTAAGPAPSAAPTVEASAAASADAAPAASESASAVAVASASAPAPKLSGKMPTAPPSAAKSASPWSLGGRK